MAWRKLPVASLVGASVLLVLGLAVALVADPGNDTDGFVEGELATSDAAEPAATSPLPATTASTTAVATTTTTMSTATTTSTGSGAITSGVQLGDGYSCQVIAANKTTAPDSPDA